MALAEEARKEEAKNKEQETEKNALFEKRKATGEVLGSVL